MFIEVFPHLISGHLKFGELERQMICHRRIEIRSENMVQILHILTAVELGLGGTFHIHPDLSSAFLEPENEVLIVINESPFGLVLELAVDKAVNARFSLDRIGNHEASLVSYDTFYCDRVLADFADNGCSYHFISEKTCNVLGIRFDIFDLRIGDRINTVVAVLIFLTFFDKGLDVALYILLASVAPEPVEEFATCCRINHKRSCHYDCSCCRSDLYSQFTYLRSVFFSHYGFLPREILVRENVICHTICDVVEFFYADIANEIVFV